MPLPSGCPHRSTHWSPALVHKRRYLFRRFIAFIMGMGALFLITLAGVLLLALGPFHNELQHPGIIFLLACAAPLAFITLISLLVGLVFRRFGPPLADVMAAADAVAGGDLSVRLKEDVPGEFGRLAMSFNRMIAELARSEQQRRNLTADVAHELRTPLHIIQGNLEGILDGVYEATPDHITATLDETRMMARLVNDLQTLSLVEAGQLPLHPTTFPVPDLLSDVALSFTGQAAQQGVDLRIDASPEAEALELFADPDRMDQVLSNLVSNALRFTPVGGSVILRANSIPGGVHLEVEDTGAGIAAEDLPFIFDRFWRADRSRSRQKAGGSGLGLAIARQLVLAHHGKIEAASQPGQGTRFSIDLPLEWPQSGG